MGKMEARETLKRFLIFAAIVAAWLAAVSVVGLGYGKVTGVIQKECAEKCWPYSPADHLTECFCRTNEVSPSMIEVDPLKGMRSDE